MKPSRSLRSVLGRGAFVAAVLAAPLVATALTASGCTAKSGATADPATKCTPGNYVFCRCQSREEGTKLCNEDGQSFGKCEPCETEDNPGIPDDPYNPPVEYDSGRDATGPGPVCGDKIVQDGEDCDDGNKIEDDGCDSTCHLFGKNAAATRSCPGLDLHVWSKPVTYLGSTVGAPAPGGLKMVCPSTTGGPSTTGSAPERIFNVTAHKTGMMTAYTSDTDYDSFIYAVKPCATTDIVPITCGNAKSGVGGESITFPVTAGQSYAVFVDGSGISIQQGNFRLTVSIQ